MSLRTCIGVLALAGLAAGTAWADDEPAPADLATVAEASDYQATSRSAEVSTLVDRLCDRAQHLRRFSFGKTVEGRDMLGVMVAEPMVAHPRDLKGDPRLVVLLLGNIHSGECAGKEALLMLLRDLASSAKHPWLRDLVLLVVPNYNADGNDRFAPNAVNRRGQIGPKEMGIRANAMGLDLNRDFIKMESPEARALVGLLDKWNPHLFIDCHTTNGSWHRYELTYDVPHNPAAPKSVRRLLRGELLPAVTETMKTAGFRTSYYGNFNPDHTRWNTYGYEPRYSTEYVGLRGRLAILSEAYAYVPFKTRIVATKTFVEACVEWTRVHPEAVRAAVTPAAGIGLLDVPIRAQVAPFKEKVLLEGYRDPPPVEDTKSGRSKRPTVPQDYEVEFWGRYEPKKTVRRPFAYLLPAGLSRVADRLLRHGICVDRLTAPVELEVEVDRILSIVQPRAVFQGHRLTSLKTKRRTHSRTLPAGAYVVRVQGALGALTCYLLEPETADGLVTWNAFEKLLEVGGDYPVLRVPTANPAERLRTETVTLPARNR